MPESEDVVPSSGVTETFRTGCGGFSLLRHLLAAVPESLLLFAVTGEAELDPFRLTEADKLRLHALGVSWEKQ